MMRCFTLFLLGWGVVTLHSKIAGLLRLPAELDQVLPAVGLAFIGCSSVIECIKQRRSSFSESDSAALNPKTSSHQKLYFSVGSIFALGLAVGFCVALVFKWGEQTWMTFFASWMFVCILLAAGIRLFDRLTAPTGLSLPLHADLKKRQPLIMGAAALFFLAQFILEVFDSPLSPSRSAISALVGFLAFVLAFHFSVAGIKATAGHNAVHSV